jgi:drug/metabolite transporter (DMT)-like permease
LGAVFLFSIQDVVVKWLTADYPVMQILGIRSAVMLLPAFVILRFSGGLAALRTRRPGGHLLRCMLHLSTFLAYYFALSRLPLAEVAAIAFSAPLIMTALSQPLLGERVGLHRWSAVLIGFLGVLLMVQPSGQAAVDWAALAVLGASFGYALMMIQTRRLGSSEPGAVILVYAATFLTLAWVVTLPFQWVAPDVEDLMLLVGLGLLGGLAHFGLIQAYRLAPVFIVSPFDYTHLVWAMAFGFLIWGDVPALATLAGAALVMASGLYILARESRLARRRAAPGLETAP